MEFLVKIADYIATNQTIFVSIACAALSTLTAIAVIWITKHYDQKRNVLEIATRMGTENWKNAFDNAHKSGVRTVIPPLEFWILHMVKANEIIFSNSTNERNIKKRLAKVDRLCDLAFEHAEQRTRELEKQPQQGGAPYVAQSAPSGDR